MPNASGRFTRHVSGALVRDLSSDFVVASSSMEKQPLRAVLRVPHQFQEGPITQNCATRGSHARSFIFPINPQDTNATGFVILAAQTTWQGLRRCLIFD